MEQKFILFPMSLIGSLVYDNVEVPYLTKYYNNTIIGYSL